MIKKIIKISIISLGLIAAVWLLKFSQDNRNKATVSGTTLSFNKTSQSGTVGNEYPLGIIVNTDEDTITAAELHLKYDATAIDIVSFTPGTILPVILTPENHNNGAMTVTLGSQPTTPFKGTAILGTLKIKIKTAKNSSISFASTTQIAAVGKNNNDLISSTGIDIVASTSTSPTSTPIPTQTSPTSTPIPTQTSPTSTPIPTPIPTDVPGESSSVLNYKIAFANVNPNDASCVVNWPLQFIVLANGQSAVYNNIVPSNSEKTGSQLVFSGSLRLNGFYQTNNVAVFIKGPKHLQMKYGKNGQSGAYNQAGGELTLTNDANTSPVYDFTNYPIIPGDVSGDTDGVQDGMINGIDFTYVKDKVQNDHVAPAAAGTYLQADLDGNCQYNTNDVNILKISLQTKQDQLY